MAVATVQSEPRFWSIAHAVFPSDVLQCSVCLALVLVDQIGGHVDWHKSLDRRIYVAMNSDGKP